MIRQPIVSGKFYENNPNRLRQEIENCFESKFGPGNYLKKNTYETIKAIIVPHAGYSFSGACASHAYLELSKLEHKKTFVIIGLNHNGIQSGISNVNWKTPLGEVEIDKALVKEIVNNTNLEINENCHKYEHSIEVQLPFLQYLFNNDFKIVPISLGQLDFIIFGNELYNTLKNNNIPLIISSDFTHYGLNYNYTPFRQDIKYNLNKLDNDAINLILNFNTNGFMDYIEKTKITICGYIPILSMLTYMKNFSNKSSKLLKYYTSGDILNDYKNSVSYASLIFK